MKHRGVLAVFCAIVSMTLCMSLVPSLGMAEDSAQDVQAVQAAPVAGADGEAEEASSTDEQQTTDDWQATDERQDSLRADERMASNAADAMQSKEESPAPVSTKEEQSEPMSAIETVEAAGVVEAAEDEPQIEAREDGIVLDAQADRTVASYLSAVKSPTIAYHTHVQTYGWQDVVANGVMSGTEGQSKRLEAIEIGVKVPGVTGGVRYRVHRQTYGWENDWKSNGEVSGTTGEAKRLEAIYIELTGDLAKQYDIYYRVHVQTHGWQDWVKNGELAGTTGEAKRLEGIEIKLVAKGTGRIVPVENALINYGVHAQTYGWLPTVADGATSGTTGEAKRLEGIQIQLGADVAGGIRYRTHVQTYGWETEWSYDGATSGTTGEAKRLEAIQIELTGDAANTYDVWYRVHAQTYGWLGWAKNGEYAGTSGRSKRLEAIEITLLKKGAEAPGSTDKHLLGESLIYIDAGHGKSGDVGYDPGALGCGYEEADLTKELVSKIVHYAQQDYGLNVYSNIGCDVNFRKRQEHALSVGATSLVSIHFNASDSSGAHGIESYIFRPYDQYVGKAGPRSGELQKIMHKHLVGALPLYDRGMESDAFAVLNARVTNLPAVLMEVCFITNPGDMQTYQAHKDDVAKALAAGLNEAVSQGF